MSTHVSSNIWLQLHACNVPKGKYSHTVVYFTILFSGVGLTPQLSCYNMTFRTAMHPDGILSYVVVVYFTLLFSGVGLTP